MSVDEVAKKGSSLSAARIIIIALLVVALDLYTKLLVLNSLSVGESIQVIPNLFNIVLTYNQGAAFGLFTNLEDGTRTIVLAITTLLALAALFYLLIKEYREDVIGQIALAMVLGGAIGNVIDRIRFAKVVDFLDFYYQSYHWPAFNVADSAIFLGVVVLILRGLMGSKTEVSQVS